MNRTVTTTFLTLVLLAGSVAGLSAEPTDSPPVSVGPLEAAYRQWTDSLTDDGSWDLQMPSETESEDLEGLRSTLLESPEGTNLGPGRKAGYLVALADRTALEGDRARARSLYLVLGTSRVSLLQMWSAYMLAGLDFAEGHYESAAAGYDRVCSDGAPAEWRDHACSMVGLARRLDALELEGGGHGDPVTPAP